MLEVQKYLKENGLQRLKDEYKINVVPHSTLPLAIYNYDQLETNRSAKLCRECRCLILDDSFDLVSRSFFRFFNLHEFPDEHKAFDWENYVQVGEKLDGSLVNVFYYNDSWQVTTRQSWAESKVNCSDITWKELIHKAFPLSDMEKVLDKNLTYTFELCSPFNKVVRQYDTTSLYLLTIFNKEQECRDIFCNASVEIWRHLAPNIQVNRPNIYSFDSFQEIEDWLRDHGNDDPTFEGFVLRDCNNYRVKVKNLPYLRLSKLFGGHSLSKEFFVNLYFDPNKDEYLSYYPEYQVILDDIGRKYQEILDSTQKEYERNKNIKSQKEFALAIENYKYKFVLFTARKKRISPEQIIKNDYEKMTSWF